MRLVRILLTSSMLWASAAHADPRAEITSLNARWTEAVAKKDVAVLEGIMGPEFELTGGGATAKETVPRQVWLANMQRLNISSYNTQITDLKVNGDFAVARVKGSWVVAMDGTPRNDAFELRDVWVRRQEGWQVVRRYIIGD